MFWKWCFQWKLVENDFYYKNELEMIILYKNTLDMIFTIENILEIVLL